MRKPLVDGVPIDAKFDDLSSFWRFRAKKNHTIDMTIFGNEQFTL